MLFWFVIVDKGFISVESSSSLNISSQNCLERKENQYIVDLAFKASALQMILCVTPEVDILQ